MLYPNLFHNMTLIKLDAVYAQDMAMLHAQCFNKAWSTESFKELLDKSAYFGLGVCQDNKLIGFALISMVMDEAELLTLAIGFSFRRRGLAKHLLLSLKNHMQQAGIRRFMLEVAEDNKAAICLYARLGFKVFGKRAGYYADSPTGAVDGVLMHWVI